MHRITITDVHNGLRSVYEAETLAQVFADILTTLAENDSDSPDPLYGLYEIARQATDETKRSFETRVLDMPDVFLFRWEKFEPCIDCGGSRIDEGICLDCYDKDHSAA